MSDDEISNEERLQIAQHYLLSSPPGEFKEVLTDVKKLLPAGILTDPLATGISRVYNIKNGKIVTAPSGNKVPLNAAAEIDPTHYVDPTSGAVYGLDHLSLETTEDPVPFEAGGELEEIRASLQAKLGEYATSSFAPEETAAGVYVKDDVITIIITSEKPNLRNFWSGKWLSVFTLTKSGAGFSLKGDIKIHAHYFEDGNVQLQTSRPVKAVSVSKGAGLADSVCETIKKEETVLRAGLDEMFGNLNTDTLRSMRRTMTVQRTKMEWNVYDVRMKKQMRK